MESAMPLESLFAQWRLVNKQANEAEHRLFETTVRYMRGEGPAPGERDRAMAAQLRSEARELFARALREVDVAATAARKSIETGPSARA
jgi:hypothetical protein